MKTASNKATLLAVVMLFAVGTSYSATLISYTASASALDNPDANGNTVDAWTVAGGDLTKPSDTAPWNSVDWAINYWTNPTTATHTFAGGALTLGQSVSIGYMHGAAIQSGTRIGIRLLDSTNAVQAEFSFLGGGSNGFEYGDTGNSFAWAATGKGYDANDMFTVTFTIGASNAYSGSASEGATGGGTGAWSGSITSAITQIQVFSNSNETGNYSSIQSFNNLAVVPEPGTTTMLVVGALGMLTVMRRKRIA